MDNVEISRRLIPFLEKASKTKQVMDLQRTYRRGSGCNFVSVVMELVVLTFLQAFGEAVTLSWERLSYVFPPVWRFNKFFNWKDQLEKSMNLWVVSYGLEWNKKQIKKAKIYYRDKSPEFLRDAVINFISAGLDTTSSAFCWFLWLLSLNQEVERNILKELETIREQKGKNIGDGYSLEDVRVMNFRGTAILQDGTFVGEGWIVMYQTFAMENTWGKNCYEFVPERWLDNGK